MGENEIRVDPVSYWAVQGGSGWLRILLAQQIAGIVFPEQVEKDMIVIRDVLDNVIRKNNGLSYLPISGGASGAVARHFNGIFPED